MQNSSQQTHYNDEIDLFELFDTIWQGKWLIIAITTLGILLAGVYAFTAQEQWTSKAQVRVPGPKQLEHYLDIEESYYRFAMLDPNSTLDTKESLEDALTIFATSLFASDDRLEALSNTTYYQTLAKELEDDTARTILLNNMATKQFSASEAIKNNPFIYNVQFSADTPSNAQKTLTEALEHINEKSLNILYERLESRINNRILSLETRALQLKNSTDQTRENKLLELQQALQSARAAGVTDYTGNSPVVGNSIIDLKNSEMLFMLGEKYLQAQLDTISNTPAIYPANYYETKRNAESLKTLLNPEAQGQMFVYTKTPEFPLAKDKPRKGLILVLGALLGGVAGVFYVLLRSALNNRRKTQQV